MFLELGTLQLYLKDAGSYMINCSLDPSHYLLVILADYIIAYVIVSLL